VFLRAACVGWDACFTPRSARFAALEFPVTWRVARMHLCEACAGQVHWMGERICFQCSAGFSGVVQPGRALCRLFGKAARI
jgi:hypothetical protein